MKYYYKLTQKNTKNKLVISCNYQQLKLLLDALHYLDINQKD